jgi:hypothetical protein
MSHVAAVIPVGADDAEPSGVVVRGALLQGSRRPPPIAGEHRRRRPPPPGRRDAAGKLIDGHRRVEAYRLLDWTAIPVHVVDLDHGQSCRVDVGTKVERGAC